MILVGQPHQGFILGDLLCAVVTNGLEVGDNAVIQNGIADDVGHTQLFVHLLHGFGIILVVQIKAGIVVCRGRHAKLYLFQQIGFADDNIKGVDCCDVQFLAEVIAAFMERHFCLFQKFIVRIFLARR